MPATRSRLPSLVLAALGVTLGLGIAAELLARALFEAPPEPYAHHPLVGLSWSPGFAVDRMTIDRPPRPFRLEIDPLGFRGKAMRTPEKQAGVYRIFFLGASTTENAFLDEERTFPGRVQTALDRKAQPGQRIEVANAGVAGTNTSYTVSLLAHRVLPLRPDLVVLMAGHADLSFHLSRDWNGLTPPSPAPPPRFKDWLVGASRLVAVVDHAQRQNHDKTRWYDRRRTERNRVPFTKPDFDVLRGLPDYERQLRRVAWLCHDQGVTCAFVTQPSLYKDVMSKEEDAALHMGSIGEGQNYDTPTLKQALDAYNEATRRVAQASDCLLIDAAREVPANLDNFVDDVHLTAQGNEAIAAAVLRAISPDGALPRPASR
jgi:lysophospholipase L1-like esterase